jgi:hypothetical protein
MPIRSPPLNVHPQVIISSRPAADEGLVETALADTRPRESNGQLQVPTEGNTGSASASGNVTNVESSAPASILDDDDDSELSELDELEVQEIQQAGGIHDPAAVKPIFPNLPNGKSDEKVKTELNPDSSGA